MENALWMLAAVLVNIATYAMGRRHGRAAELFRLQCIEMRIRQRPE